MENASKALIIAGAILLSILLISLGIYIFTGAQDTVKNSGLSSQEASTFNAAILKYEGNHKSASDVRSVKNEVITANRKLAEQGFDPITIDDGAAASYSTSGLTDTGKPYTISVEYRTEGDDNGYISNVTIDGD